MSDNVSRAYRYAMFLTDGQEAAVRRQEKQLRYAWNRMVNWQRCSLRDWKFGRRTQLLAEMSGILGEKKRTGMAAAKANQRAAEHGITPEEAVRLNRQEAVAKKQEYGPRRLGVELAQERLMAKAGYFYGGEKTLLYGLVQKFQKSCENWLKLKGRAQAPRYKKPQDSVALQSQVTKGICSVGARTPEGIVEVNLERLLGQAGKYCRVRWHRRMPEQSVVKQLAITGRPGRRYLIVFFACPRQAVLKPFGKSTSRAGIDTGYCCALTVVSNAYLENLKARRETQALDIKLDGKLSEDPQSIDGKALAGALGNLERYVYGNNGALELQPPLARDKHFLKRLRKLQRKMDRQKRAANPECFNPDGTWKKGKRARHMTNNLVITHQQVQKMHERVADTRRNYYHVAAYCLMAEHGHLMLGDWRPPALHKGAKPATKGLARRRRNMNRKGIDHAISLFAAILKDKANLSANPRTVQIVHEPYTTRTCGCCKAETGPEGPTNLVTWTCSNCGSENHRKANAAGNIREK